jgi:hypothetical protein
MIPLKRKQFPSSKADLADALDEAAHRFLPRDGQLVELRSRVFPYIDEIALNIDGARFDSPPPPPAKPQGETSPAFEAATFSLSGRNISIRGVPLNLRLQAHDLDLHRGQDENGDAMLIINNVRDGTLSISAVQIDLENAIGKIAREQSRGLTLDQVRLAMRARGRRSIAIDIQIQARKLLFRARIDVSGQIDISEDFVLRAANLKCKSDGGIGSVVCTALESVFRQIEQKSFSLNSLPFGNVQVRDVRVTVADTVEITADFGTTVERT